MFCLALCLCASHEKVHHQGFPCYFASESGIRHGVLIRDATCKWKRMFVLHRSALFSQLCVSVWLDHVRSQLEYSFDSQLCFEAQHLAQFSGFSTRAGSSEVDFAKRAVRNLQGTCCKGLAQASRSLHNFSQTISRRP